MEYITQLKQNKNPNLNDIDLKEIVRGFDEMYTEGIFVMVTNTKKIREMRFKNHRHHLHHLLGLQYLSNQKYNSRAAKVMDKIHNGNITLSDLKRDKNFHRVKKRILMIRLVFLVRDRSMDLILHEPLHKTHVMDLGIHEKDSSGDIVLGIGREKNNSNEYYFFKTLEEYKRVIENSRLHKIINTYIETN